jgi:hypothetical protein
VTRRAQPRKPKREPTEQLTQLTTRVPRSLRQRLRLFCVQREREMQDFIAEALCEHLAARLKPPR